MSSNELDTALFREAVAASGEPLPPLKRLFYRFFFGRDWRYAVLCYSYLRCVDDVVDKVEDAAASLGLMAEQKELINTVYEGRVENSGVAVPFSYGLPFFAWDRESGGPLRAQVEGVLDTIEFDVRRRGQLLSAAQLDEYVLNTGRPFLRYLAYFDSGSLDLPDDCLDLGSRAYLYADALMDLEEDLEVDLINIPAEIVEEYAIDLAEPGPGLERWRPVRAAEVLEYYRRARESVAQIDRFSMRLMYRFYLNRKERRFRRFLRERGLA